MTNEFQERRQRKADRKRTAAENAQRRADAARDKARKLADGIPLGQPILVGHHSEKRHRRDLNRIHGGFERSRDEQDKANTLLGSAIAIESAARAARKSRATLAWWAWISRRMKLWLTFGNWLIR